MSEFCGVFIIFLAVFTTVGCLLILQWTSRMPVKGDDEAGTTGHVWDGDIEEGNNPLPRWWLYLFWMTAFYGVIYVVIYPGAGKLAGVIGWTQIDQYEQEVADAEARYGDIFAAFADVPITEMASDPEAIRLGRNIYMNHCATCHGSDARGAKGFPNLTTGVWLYGGSPETIEATITNGRNGVMPALGPALGEPGTEDTVAYVMSLSGRNDGASIEAIERGRQKYMTVCIACHGADGAGMKALGAPDLTDDLWLHGANAADISDVITNGRLSQMPAQRDTLSADRIHMVAGYVLSLGPQP
jgi:cytochrome c oxidase cbb3-type subunit 3